MTHELDSMQDFEDKCAEEDSLPFTDKIVVEFKEALEKYGNMSNQREEE